jgi:hypothetical protein
VGVGVVTLQKHACENCGNALLRANTAAPHTVAHAQVRREADQRALAHDAQQRRLAHAVSAHQTVADPRLELQVRVLKQQLWLWRLFGVCVGGGAVNENRIARVTLPATKNAPSHYTPCRRRSAARL